MHFDEKFAGQITLLWSFVHQVIFVVVNTDNKDSTEVLDFFGLAAKDEVQVCVSAQCECPKN